MAVRIFQRLAEIVGDSLLKSRRDCMLKRLRLRVNLTPIEPKRACKKSSMSR